MGGFIAPQGEQSTSSEIAMITGLNELAVSPTGYFIRKTGLNTFENADPNVLSSSYFVKISSGDTTGGYLEDKLIEGSGINISKIGSGTNEQLSISWSSSSLSGINATSIADGSISNTEFQYLNGVTSSIQTQISSKQPQLNGTGFVKASGTTISYDNSTYLTAETDPLSLHLDQTTPQTVINGAPLLNRSTSQITDPLAVVNKQYVDLAVSSLKLDEYFSSTASDIGGIYYLMAPTPVGAGTVVSAAITSNTTTNIFDFATSSGQPHLDRLLAGNYDIHAHLLKTGNRTIVVYCELYTRTAGGSETLVGTSSSTVALTASDAFYDIYINIPTEIALNLTDRLVLKWYAVSSGAAGNTTVTMTVGGTADPHISVAVNSVELDQIFVPYTGALNDVALGTHSITMTGSLGATGSGKLTKIWSIDAEFTNLPTINGGTLATALSLSSYAPLASPTFSTSITTPSVLATANDSGALGASGTAFSDLFLASGGVINWLAGAATITHSANTLTLGGSAFTTLALGTTNITSTGSHTATKLTLGAASGTTGSLEINGTTSGTVTIKTADAAGTYTLTLPTSDGDSGQFLQTNGSGVLTWAAGGSGSTTALDNLASVAINTTLVSDTDNTDALGTTAIAWSDLFLGSGGVITFNSAPSTPDITLTHSDNTLTFDGGTLALGANSLTMTGSIAATGSRVTKGWFTDIESTNMPTVGGTAILTSLTAPQFTTIELGHASDTTISRSAAGVIAVEGVVIPSISSTNTLTNKRITQRVVTTTDDSTAVIDVDTTDVYELSAVANATTFSTTGTPTDGQKLIIRLKDAGVAKGLTWDAVFRAVGVTLPTTTVVSKTHYIGCIYNATDSKWDAVAVAQEA